MNGMEKMKANIAEKVKKHDTSSRFIHDYLLRYEHYE